MNEYHGQTQYISTPEILSSATLNLIVIILFPANVDVHCSFYM